MCEELELRGSIAHEIMVRNVLGGCVPIQGSRALPVTAPAASLNRSAFQIPTAPPVLFALILAVV